MTKNNLPKINSFNILNTALAQTRKAVFEEYSKADNLALKTVASITTLIQAYSTSSEDLFKPNSRDFSSKKLNERIRQDIFNCKELSDFDESARRVFFNKVNAAKYVFENHRTQIESIYTNADSISMLNDSIFQIVASYKSLTKILNLVKESKNNPPTGEKTPYDKIKTTLTTAGNQLNQALESGIDNKLLAMVQESINHLQEVINQAKAKSKLNYKTSAKKAA